MYLPNTGRQGNKRSGRLPLVQSRRLSISRSSNECCGLSAFGSGKLHGSPPIVDCFIHRTFVMSNNLVGRSEHLDLAVAKPQTAMAHPAEVSHLVIYYDHGMALFEDRFYPLKAFLFERRVPHRNDFIQNDDFRVEIRRHGKSQADVHPAGIVFNRYIDKFFQPGEINDLVELLADLFLGETQHGAIQVDVVSSRKLRMESGPYLKQAG